MTSNQAATTRQHGTPPIRAISEDALRLVGGGAGHDNWTDVVSFTTVTRKAGGG